MQQRQPRLGDILDDYCPRERRLTNHAVVAMINEDIRLTRCTTCDAEHDYKHARVPRLRKKNELAVAPASGVPAPKRIVHDAPAVIEHKSVDGATAPFDDESPLSIDEPALAAQAASADEALDEDHRPAPVEEGPVHRQLIRAQLPRQEGQPNPAPRQAPDFTIRQPAGRQNRFRPRQQRGGSMFQGGQGSRINGDGNANGNVGGYGRGGAPSRPSGRPPMPSRSANRQGGRKRSK